MALTEEEEIEELRLMEASVPREGLAAFIARISPHHPAPPHLAHVIARIERAVYEPIRLCISMPPRHAKTHLIQHAIAWWLSNVSSADTCAYSSYSHEQATSKSRVTRDLAEMGGVQLNPDMANLSEWRTMDGGGLLSGGAGSGLTGKGVSGLMVVDDPIKDRIEANSKIIRDQRWDWFKDVVMTRLEGASVCVIHCVAHGEPVLMADGTWKPVETVAPGDMVTAYEGGRFVPREVLAQRSSGDDDILEVRTDRKTLQVNARHPFLAKDGRWIKAGDLKAGDDLVVSTAAVGSTPDDTGFAWFFGFMMGDGWVTRWKRRNKKPSGTISNTESLCVCAAVSKDEKLNAKVADEMERHLGRRPRLTRFGYLRLDSNAGGRRLLDLGLSGGAHGKRIPDWVFRLTPAAKIEYLRGHAAADGCRLARCADSWRVSSVSRALVDDIRRLAVSAGVRTGRISSFKQTIRAPHSKEASPYECFSVSINFDRAPDPTEKVRSVEPAGRAEVFDLTIQGAENFIAGGFVVHNTRWHPDDMIGRIQKEMPEFEIVNLPAIAEDDDPLGREFGEALWPSQYDAEYLGKLRKTVGAFTFESLYQGRPRPRGATVFGPARYYDAALVNFTGCKVGVGADPAASEKTSADYSAAVAGRFMGAEDERKLYITEVLREQVQVPQFVSDLRALQSRHNESSAAVEGAGIGKTVVQTLQAVDPHIRVHESPTRGDKFARAQGVAAAWNDGRVLVPLTPFGEDPPEWLKDFLDEIAEFTGVNDEHDDQVDALAHLWNAGAFYSIFDVL